MWKKGTSVISIGDKADGVVREDFKRYHHWQTSLLDCFYHCEKYIALLSFILLQTHIRNVSYLERLRELTVVVSGVIRCGDFNTVQYLRQ